MEVIVMQSEAYEQLMVRVDELKSLIRKSLSENQPKQWLNNSEFCKLLGIAKRTAQTYRDRGMISYSQIGSKIYYKSSDVEVFLQKHHIKSATA